MCMIRHAIDRNQFLPFSCNDSGYVFLQLFAALGGNHTRTTGNREDRVQMNLCIGVRHSSSIT